MDEMIEPRKKIVSNDLFKASFPRTLKRLGKTQIQGVIIDHFLDRAHDGDIAQGLKREKSPPRREPRRAC